MNKTALIIVIILFSVSAILFYIGYSKKTTKEEESSGQEKNTNEVKTFEGKKIGDVDDCYKEVPINGGINGSTLIQCYSKTNWKEKLSKDYDYIVGIMKSTFGDSMTRPTEPKPLVDMYEKFYSSMLQIKSELDKLNIVEEFQPSKN